MYNHHHHHTVIRSLCLYTLIICITLYRVIVFSCSEFRSFQLSERFFEDCIFYVCSINFLLWHRYCWEWCFVWRTIIIYLISWYNETNNLLWHFVQFASAFTNKIPEESNTSLVEHTIHIWNLKKQYQSIDYNVKDFVI